MKSTYLKKGHVIFLALLIVSVSACKKNALDVPPKGFLTDETAFASEANADLFVNDIYSQLPDLNNETQASDQYTDNSACGASWETGQSVIRANALNPSNSIDGPAGAWRWRSTNPSDQSSLGNYDKIRKCNIFLQLAAKNKAKYSDAWYTKRVGEVTYLRAFFYSLLYTNYGGVPIITVPLDNRTGDDLFTARSTAEQTLAFIEADCDAAAAALPVTSENGRATKGAALTLKGWVELFAASPLSNPAGDAAKWAKAAATNQQVITLGQYNLFPDYAGQFLSANNWNKETIFARGYAAPNRGHKREGILGPVIVNGGQQAWGNLAPTQNLIDEYEMDNGKPITDPSSGYDPQNPYVHREPRFYQSIVYDGSTWQGDIFKSRIGGNNEIDLSSSSDISNTGYNGKKTLDESIRGQTSLNTTQGTSNYIFFRYAEVLLSYAEAQNEAAGPDASVYAAVNQVRQRAGSALPALVAGLTKDQMREAIRRERRIEFVFEDKRWFDIRRWDITAKGPAVLLEQEYGMKITTGAGGKLIYTPVPIFKNSFSEHMNWLPIPLSVINQSPKLTQNPGYN
ncbi:Starch-binding associating with outer membrane [Mucilaginibacter gossypiicola]|uniref:Starch-binding associating with outer membrane n=1 Tax=Mucilaginibacter gossypiicola TaxID=551995 RepID=A0A1H8NSV8_9SPHI|nr:RagB/SusD family nutrient uptake outer membrane protein [Mucilaginibacter gossypiicola]SEO32696.1 Starch-binding associating with outer membrane [Mucilaginibacter gossypiicola]